MKLFLNVCQELITIFILFLSVMLVIVHYDAAIIGLFAFAIASVIGKVNNHLHQKRKTWSQQKCKSNK